MDGETYTPSQTVEPEEPIGVDDEQPPPWPLSFRMKKPEELKSGLVSGKPFYWSHNLYRGPKDESVQIHYCATKASSEIAAQKFLNEDVLGFDMEWPWNTKSLQLQKKIALIQVASESQIGLFHLGLHTGTTVDEILAPSLRYIIESKNIAKVGNNIWRADCSRLIEFFGLKPRGIVDLSVLHRVVKYGATDPQAARGRCIAMDKIVEEHLFMPLSKDPKQRNSNWSRRLDQKQIDYAASDAYAGFILYHTLDWKRRSTKPIQPMPDFIELKLPIQLVPIELEVNKVEGDNATPSKKKRSPLQKDEEAPLDTDSQALFELLRKTRLELAGTKAAFRVASNLILQRIARSNPQSSDELLSIKGIGPSFVASYGDAFLATVKEFISTLPPPAPVLATETVSNTTPLPATLSTGLSFNLGTIGLDETQDPDTLTQSYDSERKDASPSTVPDPVQDPTLLPPRSRRFLSALSGLRNRLSHQLSRPPFSIVTDDLLNHIAANPPRTPETLQQVPGIASLMQPAEDAAVDLWKFITKHAPPEPGVEEIDLTGGS